MDKRIREILRANEKLDMWQVKGQALWLFAHLGPSSGMGEKKRAEKKEEEKERVLERETPHSL